MVGPTMYSKVMFLVCYWALNQLLESASNISQTSLSLFVRNLGPLYTAPGCFLARVKSPRRVTLLQSNVYKRLHENSGQAGPPPLAG